MAVRGTLAGWIGRGAAGGAKRFAGSGMAKPAAITAIGGAGVLGGVSAVLDRSGPYADLQESAFGDPDALRASLKAGVSNMFNDPEGDILARGDYYYGQRVSTQHGPQPVAGDVVFGMYNLRR